MPNLDDKFEKEILKASGSMRNEHKTEEFTHIKNKEDLDAYMLAVGPSNYKKESTGTGLWCPEFTECIDEVLEGGAKKYAPRDWEKPGGYSMGYKSQCDAIFHHLAREFVYKENQKLIEEITKGLALHKEDSSDLFDRIELSCDIGELIEKLKYDEMGTRHLQHVATRSVMSFTREQRKLD